MSQETEKYYIGIDVGSISTNVAIINRARELVESVYIRTDGRPVESVQKGLSIIREKIGRDIEISGAGATGSARQLTGVIVGADVVKNEITAHALADLNLNPDVQTVIEIGGQDSKIIIIRNGIVVDFAMNSVCAAGTGSFLDMQANRLGIPIEKFGELAIQAKTAVSIAGRCTVFAESDMIHKQQLGHPHSDIVKGLCEALVRNYLNNVGKGKEIKTPIMFQGGVAANIGLRAAFEKYLKQEIIVPEHFGVMGAIGSAILAQEYHEKHPNKPTNFHGWNVSDMKFETSGFECDGCSNICEIVEIRRDGVLIARWGGRCSRWDNLESSPEETRQEVSTVSASVS